MRSPSPFRDPSFSASAPHREARIDPKAALPSKPLFFTHPSIGDSSVPDYPYICVPFHDYKLLYRYKWKRAILDVGVEIFAKGAQEYPKWFFKRYPFVCQQLTEIFGSKLWCVIPDYPDDYVHNPIPHNVKRTLANIKRFHKIKGVNWIYPIQSDYLNMQSLHDSCHQVMKYEPERVAIGTVCKTGNVEYIVKCCKMVRQHFPDAWVHAFGPTLRALRKIWLLIDSFDSTAYSMCRKKEKNQNYYMCKTRHERYIWFKQYLAKLEEIRRAYKGQMRLTHI
ncbi:MAG: hypothetical protein DRJ03_18290 [Chloroflexi bacterium]|nr:MAG: hypothetical protein DRJ03_18290 [Chloroflexota bacterium]